MAEPRRPNSILTPKGFEIYENKGRLFRNKSENPNSPDFSGLVNVNGVGYDLALWKDNQEDWLNLSFTKHEIDGEYQSYQYDGSKNTEKLDETVENKEKKGDFDDDIPF